MSLTSMPSPRITVARAPIRSACLSWPFIERPASSISVRCPARAARSRGRTPPPSACGLASAMYTRESAPGSASEASRMRSIPAAHPTPGVGVAAELLDQPSRAAAPSAPPRRAARTRTRTPCACSSRARARASSRPVQTGARRAGRTPRRSARRLASSRSSSRGASAITAACPVVGAERPQRVRLEPLAHVSDSSPSWSRR